jgi:hypothetical protein
MTEALELYTALLQRSLERGVPSPAVADIFEIPLDTVKELAKEVKIARYNTADKDDYLEQIQWETLERVEQLIRSGNPDQAARIATAVFGRQIQAAGKRPSSSLEDQRAELMAAFAGVRDAEPVTMRAGRFVVGNAEIDRRARREDVDDE